MSLEVNMKLADKMRANFNKQLDDLAKEAFKFMTAITTFLVKLISYSLYI